jgi:photosystem II stability/assembly factor-like uncharacterized protein
VWAWTVDGAVGGTAQGLERSSDGGKTWSNVTPRGLNKGVGNRYIDSVFALDAHHAWVVYGGLHYDPKLRYGFKKVLSTSDGGREWTVVGRRPTNWGCQLQFVTPSVGWCPEIDAAMGSAGVRLYRTEDGGKHWRLVSATTLGRNNPPGAPASTVGSLPIGCDKSIQFTNTSIGWALFNCLTNSVPLYETTDGGTTWTRRGVSAPRGSHQGGAGFTGVPAFTGAKGAIAYNIEGPGYETLIYVSSDAGALWRSVTPPGRPRLWLVDVMTPTSWTLVAGRHILRTDNAGRTWRSIVGNANFKIRYDCSGTVEFVTKNIGWISCNSSTGTSLWRTTNGGSSWRRIRVPGT